jgi:hypothetical protein
MTCKDTQARIEAVAAGDEAAGDAFRAHVEGCVTCASALARARRIEETLAARPSPAAPPRFAALVASRIRREHWRSEQQVDWMFNVTIAAGLAAIVGGTVALVNLSVVTEALSAGVSALIAFATRPSAAPVRVASGFSTYMLGAAFLVTALLVWSWAERSGRRS